GWSGCRNGGGAPSQRLGGIGPEPFGIGNPPGHGLPCLSTDAEPGRCRGVRKFRPSLRREVMRGRAGYVLALCLGSFVVGARAQSVRLDERDAVVWSHEQVVEGRAEGTGTAGVLYVNDAPIAFTADGDFAVPVQLGEGETTI